MSDAESDMKQAATALREAIAAEREALDALERVLDSDALGARERSAEVRASQQHVHECMQFWEAYAEAAKAFHP